MICGIKLVSVFLACLLTVNGVPTPFPQGKTLVYNYYGDVKAGIIEPAAYASQYAISGQLNIKHDSSDPSLPNAYYVAFNNVKTGLHNGMAAHFQRTAVDTTIPDAARVIQDPFLLVYNDNGQLQGVKLPEDEAGWSKNMKLAIASMLQLDLLNMKLDKPFKPLSFTSQEKSIHGDCWTSYDIHSKDSGNEQQKNQLTVYKFSSPRNCSNYNVHSFNHVDVERCSLPAEAPMNMASRRVFQIENQGSNILINSLVAHGGANYFPWKGRSEAHYVLNNASFVLEKIVPNSEINLPAVDFKTMPLTSDISYQRPKSNYANNAAADLTQGRHVVQQSLLITKVKKMLGEAADYLEENHLDTKEPDFKHGHTINRILYNMGYMEVASLEEVFSAITFTSTQRDIIIKDLFIGIVPQVGTTASCIFIKNVIKMKKVSSLAAFGMLVHLPLNVRVPSEKLLLEMEELVKPTVELKPTVRRAAILCLSSLVFRTFKDFPNARDNITLKNHLNQLYNHLLNEPTYDMKIVYLAAIQNVQIGNIHELLAPIIRGDLEVSENPTHIRLLAIWAVKKSLANDYNAAHDLLWPVMADYGLPLKLRIAAYDILIRQAPTMTNILHIYWFMVYEKSQHLYNYHHTTIKGLANSVDPCDYQLRELTTKIMRFTKIHPTVPYQLSSSYMVDAMDDVYGHGEKFEFSLVLNELTGVPEVIHFDYASIEGRKPVSNMEVYLHVEGFDGLGALINKDSRLNHDLGDINVLNLLNKAAEDLPPSKPLHIDLILMHRGRVSRINHYTKDNLLQLREAIIQMIDFHSKSFELTKAMVAYESLYEQQIISEMGLPVVLENRVPRVTSLKLNVNQNSPKFLTEIELEARIWRHGDYSMSTYNPLMDVWHSIRRTTAMDVTVPIKVKVNLSGAIKLTFPRLPATQLSTAGAKLHAKDITTVTEDENNTLQTACPACHHQEVVSKGPNAKKSIVKSTDCKDTGLQYTSAIFDCENEISPVTIRKDWLRAMAERKNSWAFSSIHAILGIRQQMKNYLISAPMGSCGSLIKTEPSIVHPTSHVDLTMRASMENLEEANETLHLLNKMKFTIHGALDAIAASTNQSARSWDMHMNLDMSPDHTNNILKVQLTRVTPGETNLKICLDGQKTYPELPHDMLKVGVQKEIVDSKLTISMAKTNDDKCSRDEGLVTITVKGQISEEQKKLFNHESIMGACSRDMKNPLYKSPNNLTPRTVNCLDEAIKHTTLRKYTVNIAHKKVPPHIITMILAYEDLIRATALGNIKYTAEHIDSESVKLDVEFPINDETYNMSVVTPSHSYDLTDVDLHIDNDPRRHLGFGDNNNKHLWTNGLSNSRFAIMFLRSYTENLSKFCSLYPKIAVTVDGGEIPYVLPSEWTLATGDVVHKNFAIFVKNVDNKLALKVYAEGEVVEVLPVGSVIRVTINGEVLDNVEKGSNVPVYGWPWVLKVIKYGDEIIIPMNRQPVWMLHSGNSVSIFIDSQLQGQISGLCGNMDGTHVTKIPKEHRLVQA